MQAQLDKTNSQIKQKQAEMARLFAQQDVIINKYSDMPAASGMSKDQTLDYLVNRDSDFQRLGAMIDKLETQLIPLNKRMEATKEKMSKIVAESSKVNGNLNRTANGLKNVNTRTDQVKKSVDKLSNSTKKVQGHASKTLSMIKGMIASMIVFSVVSGFMRAITEGFQNMAQASGTANDVLSQLSSGFLYAKNAIASAFMPILQALTPVITTVTNSIANLFNWIAMFTTALFTGSSTVTIAKKAQIDYAASIDKTSKAAKGQLAAFDELNSIQVNDSSTSGISDSSEMFEEVKIPTGINNLVDGIKRKFEEFKVWLKNFSPSFEAWNTAFGKVGEAWGKTKDRIQNSLESLQKGGFGELGNYISNTFFPNVVNGFNTTFAPIFGQVMPVVLEEFGKDFEFACQNLNKVSEDILLPAFQFIEKVAKDIFRIISQTWEQYGGNILTQFTKFKESLRTIWENLYENIIKPVCETIGKVIDGLWENHLKGLWQNISDFFGAFIEAALTVWNNVLSPLINWLIQTMAPIINWVVENIGGIIGDLFGMISDVISGLFKSLEGLMNFITGVFSGDWEKAWTGICKFVEGIWNMIWGVIKGVINLIVDALNLLWSAVYSVFAGIANGIGGAVGWLGSLFGQQWGFSMPKDPPLIPKLATGGVITSPTLAMVGEYSGASSNPEIVSPQSTMQETFITSIIPLVSALENGFQMVIECIDNKDLNTYFEGRPLARALKPFLDTEDGRIGSTLFSY